MPKPSAISSNVIFLKFVFKLFEILKVDLSTKNTAQKPEETKQETAEANIPDPMVITSRPQSNP